MNKTKHVKLSIYQEVGEETWVETFKARDFSDFMLVELDGSSIKDAEDLMQIHDQIEKTLEDTMPDKVAIIVDKGLDLNFYGFEVIDD